YRISARYVIILALALAVVTLGLSARSRSAAKTDFTPEYEILSEWLALLPDGQQGAAPRSPDQSALGVLPAQEREKNCTYTAAYWVDHPGAWMTDNIVVGEVVIHQTEIIKILRETPDTLPNAVL